MTQRSIGEVVTLIKQLPLDSPAPSSFSGKEVTIIEQHDIFPSIYKVQLMDGSNTAWINATDIKGQTEREDKTCEVTGCKHDRLLFEHYCSTHIHQYGNKKPVPVTVDNKPVENTIEQLILIEGEHYAIDGYGEELSNGSRWAVLRKVEL